MPRSRLLALIVLCLLPLIVFHRVLFFGEAFVPADLLSYLSPWKSVHPPTDHSASWNVLRFDGITQFYPWRVEVARQIRAGHLPFWNPYQFAANGGTPLLANSQSAPLYPLHILFYLVPPSGIWYVFGLVAALHLAIAGSGLYRLLRSCDLERGSALIGAATWTLSAPVICWLSLPSFLGVACWLPWLLLLVRRAHRRAGTIAGRTSLLAAGGIGGVMILAGHLQIALYALLATLLYALWLGIQEISARHIMPVRWIGGIVVVGALAICVSAPQVLPAVELSRISHRAVTEKSSQLYNANNSSAMPVRCFATLLIPDFYGHPNQGLHWNNSNLRDSEGHSGNNYAEWANYVGILPLLLAVFALTSAGADSLIKSDRGYFALLALVTLLIATGTPLNLLLFYVVPGYASLANPGRVLVVFALAMSALAAFGFESLLKARNPVPTQRRFLLVSLAIVLVLGAWGASQGALWARTAVAQVPFAQLMNQANPGILATMVLLVFSGILIWTMPMLTDKPDRLRVGVALCLLLIVADLSMWGYGYNPTVKPDFVYPVTPGIRWLQRNAANARIAVINRDWTLGQTAPEYATLPPNSLTVYQLHDISGYDSLFPKVAKEQVSRAGFGEDASPPANGNMVIVKRLDTALRLGAEYIVLAADAPAIDNGPAVVYRGDDLIILRGVDPTPRKEQKSPIPISFWVGLSLCGTAMLVIVGAGVIVSRQRP